MRWLIHERGSALLSTLAVTFAALLGVALLMDFFGIYAAKRSGQTAADAGALGAMAVVEASFNRVARTSLDGKVAAVHSSASSQIDREMSDWETWTRAYLRARLEAEEPPLTPAGIEAEIDRVIREDWYGVYQGTRHSVYRSLVRDAAVAGALIEGRPMPLTAGLGEFYTAQERGCLVHRAVRAEAAAIRAAAQWYASQNGAETDVAVTFPYQGLIKVQVIVQRAVPLGLTARFVPRQFLPVEATALAADPSGLSFDLSGSC